jgi:hypothetical protein
MRGEILVHAGGDLSDALLDILIEAATTAFRSLPFTGSS